MILPPKPCGCHDPLRKPKETSGKYNPDLRQSWLQASTVELYSVENHDRGITMNKSIINATLTILLASTGLGCATAPEHRAAVDSHDEASLTLAAVQRSVHLGMSGAEVLQSLGSPNIVSTDENRHEVWVYDRVATEYTYSESNGGLVSLLGGASGSVAGGVLPSYKQKAGATRRSQKTLTIIVHFDGDTRVKDFSYHASSF